MYVKLSRYTEGSAQNDFKFEPAVRTSEKNAVEDALDLHTRLPAIRLDDKPAVNRLGKQVRQIDLFNETEFGTISHGRAASASCHLVGLRC